MQNLRRLITSQMKPLIRWFGIPVSALLLLSAPTLVAQSGTRTDAAYVQKVADGEMGAGGVPEKSGMSGWWARSWTKSDGAGFHGKPKSSTTTTTDNPDSNIVIRYTRYSTEYNVESHSPVWGAYTIDKTAVANEIGGERPASNPDFARPGQFFQEPLVVAHSRKLDVPAASHGTFTSTYDPRYPLVITGRTVTADEAKTAKAHRSIERGHMVPNNAMKCQGTIEQGQTAQIESFSVANIVPQMSQHNNPTWSSLEDACFDWANELGQVWMFVGPIYGDDPAYIKKVKDDSEQVLASPDALYYVVIGKRGGKVSAIGFVIPHVPEKIDFRSRAVPVDEIERMTGLDFMPDLREPNAVEAAYDEAWLKTKPRKKRTTNDG